MRLTLMILGALAAAVPLQAQWTNFHVYAGVAGTDIPVGIAAASFGHDLVLVVERRDGPNGPATQHFQRLFHFQCTDPACTVLAFPQQLVPPAPAAGLASDQYYNGSLALNGLTIYALPFPPFPGIGPLYLLRSAHVVRREGPTAGCSSVELDLGEQAFDFSTATWSAQTVAANSVGACEDRQLSYTQRSKDTLYTCWAQDPTAAANDNQVWCGTRPLTSTWSTSLLADGVDDQDHMSFVVDPVTDWRYIVHRDRDASPDNVALRVPEMGTAGSLVTAPADQLDYPSIARAPDGSFHAVWHFPKNTGGFIHYASCPATSDCTVAGSWTAPVQIRTANGARHAEIAASADGKLMVAWMETDGSGDRIHFKETCVGNNWPFGAGEVPRVAAGQAVSQSTFIGRPHIAIDDAYHFVHLGFVEFDNPANPTAGDAWWSRKSFTTCN
jgi:hypothetical protein